MTNFKRHNRRLTHEVFSDGTTIDGSRLEKAMGDIEDGVNRVAKGDLKQRFVAVQYHSGFQPQVYTNTSVHHFPWLRLDNVSQQVFGSTPTNAPFNPARFKGTVQPGIDLALGAPDAIRASKVLGTQYAWTRTFSFLKPVIIDSLTVFMRLDSGANAQRPYTGSAGALGPFVTGSRAAPPLTPDSNSADMVILIDVFNPVAREDCEQTDVEFIRRRFVINDEAFTFNKPDPDNDSGGSQVWDDMFPVFINGTFSDIKSLEGRMIQHEDLNIPIHQGSKVRLAVVLPEYDGTVFTAGSWGAKPWFINAWDSTLTVLEEVSSV